jgi:cytochrome P450
METLLVLVLIAALVAVAAGAGWAIRRLAQRPS